MVKLNFCSVVVTVSMAASSIQVGLPSFSGSGSVRRFVDDFKTFAVIQEWDATKQVAVLPLCLSGIARDAYDSLSDKVKGEISSALEGLRSAFPSGGVVEAQVKLRTLKFQPGSNLDAFVVSLRTLVVRAFPQGVGEDVLFGYFLQALPQTFQQQLVSEGIQTFDRAVRKVRNMCCAASLVPEVPVRQVSSETEALKREVEMLQRRLAQLEGSGPRGYGGGRPQPFQGSKTCHCCGLPGHVKASCRHRHLPCHTCNRIGHLARVCQGNMQRAGTVGPGSRPSQFRAAQPSGQGAQGPIQPGMPHPRVNGTGPVGPSH